MSQAGSCDSADKLTLSIIRKEKRTGWLCIRIMQLHKMYNIQELYGIKQSINGAYQQGVSIWQHYKVCQRSIPWFSIRIYNWSHRNKTMFAITFGAFCGTVKVNLPFLQYIYMCVCIEQIINRNQKVKAIHTFSIYLSVYNRHMASEGKWHSVATWLYRTDNWPKCKGEGHLVHPVFTCL